MRTLALTLMNMPMIPEAIEQAAPTRNAMPVRQPRSKPLYWVSATCLVTRAVITPVITTAPTRAKIPIVEYWRRMNATAPSKIVPATSCISLVPGVPAQDVAGEVEREQHGDQARRQDDQLES